MPVRAAHVRPDLQIIATRALQPTKQTDRVFPALQRQRVQAARAKVVGDHPPALMIHSPQTGNVARPTARQFRDDDCLAGRSGIDGFEVQVTGQGRHAEDARAGPAGLELLDRPSRRKPEAGQLLPDPRKRLGIPTAAFPRGTGAGRTSADRLPEPSLQKDALVGWREA